MRERRWPSRVLDHAPVWCSVDLRDGNQALAEPMNPEEKLLLFNALVGVGFREIEVGFPSASDTEFETVRMLIEEGHIPDNVTIQVIVAAREALIERTFKAIRGAKNVILHFYNPTSALQRKVVFHRDMAGVIEMAVDAARQIRELAGSADSPSRLRFEYSPESFTATEPDNAVEICRRVMEVLGPTAENPMILDLPATVENCPPNGYADRIEYFVSHLPGRERAIISLHPHNDRGTAVAAAEMGLLAGGQRVEGTLFGNGERTGNVDLVTLALNLYSQGVEPGLDFSNLRAVRDVYEAATGMKVPPRHPYAGELVFTAFSGAHQDAIQKGMEYMQNSRAEYWEVPYLPIDPADIGRAYEPIIRINSQSGKGGAAFVMQTAFGYQLPRAMQPEFGAAVKAACDRTGRELLPREVFDLFQSEYRRWDAPCRLLSCRFIHSAGRGGAARVTFRGAVRTPGRELRISGSGNGPIDAFFRALRQAGLDGYSFVSYSEQAVSAGSDSRAVAYVHLRASGGEDLFGVGEDDDISMASIRAVLSAVNRHLEPRGRICGGPADSE